MAETPNHRHPEVAYSSMQSTKSRQLVPQIISHRGALGGAQTIRIINHRQFTLHHRKRSPPVSQFTITSESTLLRISQLYPISNTVLHTQSQPIMDPSQVDVPPLKDLTIDNITENVNLINSGCPDPRMKYLLERLVQHLHDYARETRLSHNEWMTAIQFLTSVGQICTDVRQVRYQYSVILLENHQKLTSSRNSSSSPTSSASPC
jgi:hypothetical protein